jgi:hypothetical protein
MTRTLRHLAAGIAGLSAIIVAAAPGCSSTSDGAKPGSSADGGGTNGKGDAAADGTGGACVSTGPLLDGDCDPIDRFCGFPFPSNVYLAKDASGKNPSGKALKFGATTLPMNVGSKKHIAPELITEIDGFSPASMALTYLPGATATGLPSSLEIPKTLDAASPTIILDADTGALVPHWVDIDAQSLSDDQRAVMLHPAVLLKNQGHYIVAIRKVQDKAGAAIAPTDAFRALRDGTASTEPSVESRRCLYKEIFAKLDKAGVKKDDLQVAWDFTVGSRKSITNPMVQVRDAALAAVGDAGPAFTIKKEDCVNAPPTCVKGGELITENPNKYIMRRIILTMKAPLYLSTADYKAGDPVPRLQFDASGKAKQNGTMDMDILVQIPNSVKTAGAHGLLQNGHGLFGGKEEGQNGYAAVAADGYHWIELATDLFGFASDDVLIALESLQGRVEILPGFIDRQIQGMVNQLVAMRLMMGQVAKDGIKDASGKVILDPAWIDPKVRAYRGDSQGGIMGGTYMSVSTDVTRGLLGEFGTPYSVLLNRSSDATGYNKILNTTYGDGRAVQLIWALTQLFWDRSEPSGFVPFMSGSDRLPNTPDHHVLMHDALGDHQVTTMGAHIMARAVGAKLLQSNDPAKPFLRVPWGLEKAAGPLQDQSALVEWDFNLAPIPVGNLQPTDGCDPHDRLRQLTPAYEQQDHFFRTGEIKWYCDGVCNCDGVNEEGNCAASYVDKCRSLFCTTLMDACTGANAQFQDRPPATPGGTTRAAVDVCQDVLATYPITGTWGEMRGNTLQCRMAHLHLTKTDPATACLDVGPTGGTQCN